MREVERSKEVFGRPVTDVTGSITDVALWRFREKGSGQIHADQLR
jgi:hypothetical protein